MLYPAYPPVWWQHFDRERILARAAALHDRETRVYPESLLEPLLDSILLSHDEIRAGIVDMSELSARDYLHLRSCALALATAFGAMHVALADQDGPHD